MGKIQNMRDLEDFVRGATLFGTGGGGSQVVGKNLLMESFNEGKTLEWVPMESIVDDAWTCTALYMGSIAPLTEEAKKRKEELGLDERTYKRVLVQAVKELEQEINQKIDVIVPIELGGINSPAPLDAAAQLGKKMVDGDYSGRAVPEIAQALPVTKNLPICPVACVDAWGDVSMIRRTRNYDMAEGLGKMLSIPAFEPIGLACFAVKASEMKKAVVPGTMTKCLEAGREVRLAVEKGEDPAAAFAKKTNGYLLFKGEVAKKEWWDKGGYMYGEVTLSGAGEYKGKGMRVWFKNENHMTWLDEKPFVMSPDLIQLMDSKTGDPLTNTDIQEGMSVSVVGIPNPKYRTEEGLRLMGPVHYGFDYQYTPIEKLGI